MENNASNLIENETLGDLKDKRKVHDLLGCLLFLSKYHNRETSAESLTFGLPIHKTSMNISMFHQASSRIGLVTKTVKRNKLKDITKLALPSVLILNKNRACVLINYDLKKGIADVIIPGLISGETQIDINKLDN